MYNEGNSTALINNIKEEELVEHCKKLWFTNRQNTAENYKEEDMLEGIHQINCAKKGPGCINEELLTYGGICFHNRILYLLNTYWKYFRIPATLYQATRKITSIFENGRRNMCDDYYGSSLS
jgi:hypothetical protein